MTSEPKQRVSSYLYKHTKTPFWITKRRLGLPRSSIQRNFRKRLHLLLYKPHIVQELEEREYEACIEFATWGPWNAESNSFFFKPTFSIECVFSVDGKGNKHNVTFWRSENHYQIKEVSRHSGNVAVRYAWLIDSVIGPYYFADAIVASDIYFY